MLTLSSRMLKLSASSDYRRFFPPHLIPCSPFVFPVLLKTKSIKMIHIKGDRTQPCLTPDLRQNQQVTSFPTLIAAALFSYIALITLIYLSGIKQFVVTNCSKEQPGSIVTKTLKNGILVPIAT